MGRLEIYERRCIMNLFSFLKVQNEPFEWQIKTLSVDIVRGKHGMIQLFEGENFFIWVRSVTQLAVPTCSPPPLPLSHQCPGAKIVSV